MHLINQIWITILHSVTPVKLLSININHEYRNTIDDIFKPLLLTNVSFGTPWQHFNLCVSFSSAYTWIIDAFSAFNHTNHTTFNKSSSSTYSEENTEALAVYEDKIIYGKWSEDIAVINGATINKLHFALASFYRDIGDCDGVLGLQWFHLKKSLTTFMTQLYRLDIIRNQAYLVEYSDTSFTRLSLTFTNPSTSRSNKEIFNCDIINDKAIGTWSCRVKRIEINGRNVMNSEWGLVKYDQSFGWIKASSKYKTAIISTYLQSHIDQRKCQIKIYYGNSTKIFSDFYDEWNMYEYYLCDKTVVFNDEQYNIALVFNILRGTELNAFTMIGQDLLVKYNSTHNIFGIVFRDGSKGSSLELYDWIIGNLVLRKYAVKYDKEKFVLNFFENKNIFSLKSTSRMILMISNYVALLMGIACNLYVKYVTNNMR